MTSLIPRVKLSVRKSKLSVRKYRGTLLVLTIIGCATSLRFRAHNYEIDARWEEPRLLRVSALNDHGGNATAPAIITIHIADKCRANGNCHTDNPSHSIFYTDVLRRYGSGRFGYRVVAHSGGDSGCRAEPFETSGPCLVVTSFRGKGQAKNAHKALKCNFPQCKTMVTNDELCRTYADFDVRGYYSAKKPHAGYLPLGPRRDAWASFQKIQAKAGFASKFASERRYAFNAIFSQDTNKGRSTLAKVISSQPTDDALPTFTTIAKEWTSRVNDPRSKQLDTNHYMAVVLDSVFTLAPAGHNAECYRMFEAAEAGSIPVFLRAELYGGGAGNRCKNGLKLWYDSPALVLDKWSDLYPTVKALMDDPAALDERQEHLRLWYEGYMRRVVAKFEDLMVTSEDVGTRAPLAEVPMENAPVAEAPLVNVVGAGAKKKKKKRKNKRRRRKEKKVAMILQKKAAVSL